MRFEEALQLHREGKDIKRTGMNYVIGPDCGEIELTWSDVVAEDWQEVEDSTGRRRIQGWRDIESRRSTKN